MCRREYTIKNFRKIYPVFPFSPHLSFYHYLPNIPEIAVIAWRYSIPEGPPPAPVNVKLAIIPANIRVDNNSPTFTISYNRNSVCIVCVFRSKCKCK